MHTICLGGGLRSPSGEIILFENRSTTSKVVGKSRISDDDGDDVDPVYSSSHGVYCCRLVRTSDCRKTSHSISLSVGCSHVWHCC